MTLYDSYLEFSLETCDWAIQEIDRLREEHRKESQEYQRRWDEILEGLRNER